MDFYDKLFKNCHFWPQNEPKGPQDPIETPCYHENNFFQLPGYENPILRIGIFELSPIVKKLVWPYQALGGYIGFLAIWGSSPRKNWWWLGLNRSIYRSGQFKKNKIDVEGGIMGDPPSSPYIAWNQNKSLSDFFL